MPACNYVFGNTVQPKIPYIIEHGHYPRYGCRSAVNSVEIIQLSAKNDIIKNN